MRKIFWLGFFLSFSLFLLQAKTYADIIHAEPVLVAPTDQWFEASSQYNVAMRITITADSMGDTLNVLGIRNDWYNPYAANSTDIVAGSVRLWYVQVDSGSFSTSTAQFVTVLTDDIMDPYVWYDISLNQFVEDGSALYITIDITATPTSSAICAFHVFEQTMSFASGGIQPPPTAPPDFYPQYPETDPTAFMRITPYLAATGLEISHTSKSLSQLSSGQTFYPMDITAHNTGTPFTAPVFLTGITVTVKDSIGTTLAPDTALESIGLRNKTTQVVLSTVSSMPATPTGIYIPLGVSVTAIADLNLELFATVSSNTGTVVPEFRLEVSNGSDVAADDAYTRKAVSIGPAGSDAFPMQTDLFTVFFSATDVDVYHAAVLAQDSVVLKGQTDVNPLNFTFSNPGTTRTSRVDITHITLAVTDSSGSPVVPSTVFSRVAISGEILYGETTTIPTSGSLLTITLSNSYASVPVYKPLTVTVLADILPDASAVDFQLSLAGAAGVTAQDANTILPVNVSAAFTSDPFPMFSNVIKIASTFQVSGRSLAPATVYPEQRSTLLELTFSHPGPTGVGNLLIQGITVTAQDQNGGPVNLGNNCTTVFLTNAQGSILSQATPGASGNTVFLSLPDITVAPFDSTVINVGIQMSSRPEAATLRVGIGSNNDITVFQPLDPARPVFVAGLWPLLCQSMAVGGGEGELRLANYPNPFAAGRRQTTIAYFLKTSSTVTARIYTLQGDQVQSLAESEFQAAGEQLLTWNGRTASGSAVKNGVYLLQIEAVTVASGETTKQLRKIAVVK